MKKITTTILAVLLAITGANATTPDWGDAAAAKSARQPQRQAAAPEQSAVRARQQIQGAVAGLSEKALRSGAVTGSRLSAPKKAVTAADLPVKPLQLTYNKTRFELANPATVTLKGDSIFLGNFFGWGTTIKAKVDLTTGDFTINRQQVYMHPTYGNVDLMACDVDANVFDPNGTIPGHISEGKVEIGQWVALITEGEYKNRAIGYGLHKKSDFVGSNATMTSQIAEMDSTGKVIGTTPETIDIYVEKPGTNSLCIYNLSNTGGKVDCYLNSDSTFSIAPQQLMSNTYGDFFCYPADWNQGVYWPSRDITGPANNKTLHFGNWGIYTNTGKYYYRRYVSTELSLPFDLTFPPTSAEWAGTGTEEDPYIIATAADLFRLSEKVNSATIPDGAKMVKVFEGKYFKQTKTINMKGYLFPPIGGSDDMKRFAGNYNGDNKTISNLTVSTGSKGYAALFGAVDTVATLKNITLSAPDISCENYYYAGGVAAYSMGKIENCKVTNGKIRGYLIAGGVCGSSGPATGLSFTGTVEGATNVGGVIGNMRFPITKCNATNATVTGYGGRENYSVGGVVGYMTSNSLGQQYGGYIEDCYFSGQIIMNRYAMFAGGIAGCSTEADIRRCFALAEISTTSSVSSTAAGGIVGAIQGVKVENCFFNGNMEVGGSWTSPLVGYAINIKLAGHPERSEITNCYMACHSRSISNYSYSPYLGWFDTRTYGEPPIITNCRIDGSLHPNYNTAKGFTALADMISGEPWENYSTEIWKFEKGSYPTLATIGSNSVANVAKAPINFTGTDNVENVANNFTVSTAGSVKWTALKDGVFGTEGHGVIISGANVQLNGSIATDTIRAANGNIYKWVVMKLAPAGIFDGEGTAEKPYLIKDKADLIRLSEATTLNQLTFYGSHFLITADINLQKDTAFKGISNCASSTYKFGGILDGGNHTITGISLVYPVFNEAGLIVGGKTSTRGFIGRIKKGGAVKNLRLGADNEFIFYSSSGAFVGENYGDIINCRNYAKVIAHAGTSGAICGYNRAGGRIEDCFNAGEVVGGYHYVGGIVSYNYGVVQNCQNVGKVSLQHISSTYTTSKLDGAGGVIMANFAQAYNVLNTGYVEAEQYVGGIESWHNTTDKQKSLTAALNLGDVYSRTGSVFEGQVTGKNYTVPDVASVYWDAQVSSVVKAAQSEDLANAKGLKTNALTSGEPVEGLDTAYWSFAKGRYPMLKMYADEPMAVAAATAVVNFGDSEHHLAVKHDAALAQAEGLKWSLAKGNKPFIVNGNVLEMYAGKEFNDTLVATNGNYVRRYALMATPDTLAVPQLADTLLCDKETYKLVFSHTVPGVTYYYTINNTAPGPDNSASLTTNGVAEVRVVNNDITVRAIAAHRNYYPSAEISRVLKSNGIGSIDDTEVPASVIYVNASGLTSASPWQGVNVVITTFANGTRKIEKVNFNR